MTREDEKDDADRERYLWDPRAEATPEIARLEAALGELRPAPELDASKLPTRSPPRARRRLWPWLGVAAAAAAAITAWVAANRPPASPDAAVARASEAPASDAPSAATPAPIPSATFASEEVPACRGADCPAFEWRALRGAPTVDGKVAGARGRLPLGGWIETDASAAVTLDVADIGHVEIAPGSRLRLLQTDGAQHRLALAHGSLSAKVDAPPRLFVIDTPGARAVDLGCAYDLAVAPDGRGLLRVTAGAVELDAGVRRPLPVVVPRGAECAIDPARGPGTPVWSRASVATREALAAFDQSPDEARTDAALATLGERDSLTLVHLLEVAPASRRGAVLDRLAPLEPAARLASDPKARAALLAGERATLVALRAAFEPRWYASPENQKRWH